MGHDKADYFTTQEAHAVLDRYVSERLAGAASAPSSAAATAAPPAAAAPPGVEGWLADAGIPAARAAGYASALAAEGFDSVRALRAGGLAAADLAGLGLTQPHAAVAKAALDGEVRAFLDAAGAPAAAAVGFASALAADGFDSVRAMRAHGLRPEELRGFGLDGALATAVAAALAEAPAASGAGSSGVDESAARGDGLAERGGARGRGRAGAPRRRCRSTRCCSRRWSRSRAASRRGQPSRATCRSPTCASGSSSG